MKKILSVFLAVLLICTTGINLLLSSAAEGDAPVCKVFDFENVTAGQFTAIAKSGYASEQSIETTDVISGSGSWKIAFPNAASVYNDGAALSLGNFDKTKAYRVSGKYRILSGTLATTRIVNSATNTNFNHIFSTSVPAGRHFFINEGALTASTTVRTFSNTVEPTSNNGFIALAAKPAGNKTAEVVFDDITVAEIITAPTASADASMGTATVANKAGYSDYAAGEIAVFTVTAKDGYRFVGWEDSTGAIVSTNAVYNHVLSNTIALTAKFAPDGLNVFDFENVTAAQFTAIAKSGYASEQSIETTDVISGSGSWKIAFPNAASKYNDGAALSLGNFDKTKAYRVSGKYRILSGTLATTRIVNSATNTNFDHIFSTSVPAGRHFFINEGALTASTTVRTFSNTVEPTSNNGFIALAVKPAGNKTAEVVFDDITVAEIITAPTASADAAKGSVSVANKDGHGSYAVGDTAVFTATANDGYRFVCWEDENGYLVSEEATYNHVLSKAIVLTAKFELDQGSGGQDQDVTVSFAGTPTPMDAITGAVGESMTVPAAPAKDGYHFAGWYTDAEFNKPADVRFFPTENQTFYAKYVEGNLWVQNFESYPYTLNGSATQPFTLYKATDANDTNVYEGKYSLKKDVIASGEKYVSVSNNLLNLKVGSGYKLTFKLKVTEVARTSYINFRHINQYNNAWSYGNHPALQITAFPTSYANTNEWVEHTCFFVAETPYFALSAASGVAFYLDDIKVEEMPVVDISFVLGEGLTMDPVTGVSGQAFNTKPTTAPEGKKFAGWYTDAELKNTFSSKTFPASNVTLYARWLNESSFEQDFEFWPFQSGTNSMSSTFTLYEAKDANDPNVYNGSYSLFYNGMALTERKTTGFTIFDSTTGKLQLGEKYKMTVRYKPVESVESTSPKTPTSTMCLYYTKSYTNFWNGYVQGPLVRYAPPAFKKNSFTDENWTGTTGVTTTTLTKDANGWLTATYEFTATSDYLALFFTGYFDMYIDTINVDALPSGVVVEDYESPYCEPFYNELGVIDVMDSLNGGKKQVFEIPVNQREDYVFTAILKKSGTAKTKVYLAWDKDGNDPIDKTVFTASGSSAKLSSSRMITSFNQSIYLIVENGSKDSVSYLAFFPTKFATAEDLSNPIVPDKADYENLTTRDADSTVVLQKDDTDNTEDNLDVDGPATQSPTTGEANILLVCLLILGACTILMVAVFRKGARD